MILGIGSDLIDVRRIEKTLETYGARFEQRVFTAAERAKAARRAPQLRAATYAKRFAAKEACCKALGTGIGVGVYFSHMGVENLPSGAPTLVLTGGALARLQAITPAGHRASVHLSLTDDLPLAMAFVVIEAVPCAAGAV
jgi:holo-[acyl-carrier protein] synthase